MVKLIPNVLTFFRILLAFVFAALFANGHQSASLLVFVVASFSDFLDGYLARRLHVSRFGAILDPLADKLLMFVSFTLLAGTRVIPYYVAVTVISRDLLIVFVVCLCFARGIHLQFVPAISSKINTVIQLLYVISVLTCKAFAIDVPLDVFDVAVCCSTVMSGVDYARKYAWIKDVLAKR